MVLVALTLSAALLLVEVALPTFGVAGLTSFFLAAVALTGAADRGTAWWPLLLVGAAVSVWAVLLAGQWSSPAYQIAAASLFAAGSVGYALLARDAAAVALAAAGSVGLPGTYRPLFRAAGRLRDMPPQLGMDALVGRGGTVTRWDNTSGTVRVDGSLWNASGSGPLQPGAEIVVVGHSGMTVDVARRAAVP